MEIVLFYFIASTAALLAALAVIFAISTSLHLRQKYLTLTFPLLVGLLAINLAVQPILNGRDLRTLYMGSEFLQSGFKGAWAVYTGKLLIYVTMLIAAIEILHQFVRKTSSGIGKEKIVLIALIFYFSGAFVLPGLFGTNKGLAHYYFYLPILFGALYFSAGDDPSRVVRYFRNAIAGILVATLIIGLVAPNMVIQQNFRGAIPLFNFRLWGLAAHPNAFAPIALAFLVLLRHAPFENHLINRFFWILGAIAILTAQSKTVWVIAVTLVAISHLASIKRELRRSNASLMSISIVGGSAVAMIGLCLTLLGWSLGLIDIDMSRFNSVDTKTLSTLSGRDVIWELSLREWRANPVFGYGLNLWDDDYRRSMALLTAYHAHNQFYQTLGASGTIGILALMTYLLTLGFGTLKVKAEYKTVALALFFLLLIRCFSEPPFEMRSIADANVVLHLCLFGLVVASLRCFNRVASKENAS